MTKYLLPFISTIALVFTPVLASAQTADMSLNISLAGPNNPALIGDSLTLFAVFTNVGPDDVDDVTIPFSLPPQVELVSAVPSQGLFDENTGIWTLGDIPDRVEESITITVRVLPGSEGQTANFTANLNTTDPDYNFTPTQFLRSGSIQIAQAEQAPTSDTADSTDTQNQDNQSATLIRTGGNSMSLIFLVISLLLSAGMFADFAYSEYRSLRK